MQTTLVDVDNTLIDNDRAKEAMNAALAELLGSEGATNFWATYEAVRTEHSVVDIPRTITRFIQSAPGTIDHSALAAVFMAFPFDDFVYPGARETIAHLRTLGPVVILSDGDQVFQPTKINRSGLATAVDGYVLVFPHKEEHLAEIAAVFPADRFVLIDDKPTVIEKVTARKHELNAPLQTVFVRQGKYAANIPPGPWPGATHTIDTIAQARVVVGNNG